MIPNGQLVNCISLQALAYFESFVLALALNVKFLVLVLELSPC